MIKKLNTKHKSIFCIICILVILLIVIVFHHFLTDNRKSYYYTAINGNHFVKLEFYEAEKYNYLGKWPNNVLKNIYNLNGLPDTDYLYISEGYIISNSPGSNYLIMHETVCEPILSDEFSVKKLEININENQKITIDDEDTLLQILSLRRQSTPMPLGYNSETGMLESNNQSLTYQIGNENAVLYFELPCGLSWKCYIEKDSAGTIHFVSYDVENAVFYDFDATTVLSKWIK